MSNKQHLTATTFSSVSAHYAYAVFVCVSLFLIEREPVAGMRFSNVCYLETFHLVVSVPAKWPKVENMLDIFYRVDMAVYVNIVVEGVNGSH